MSKVMIGMSGGVDSSVAAFLLKEQGYDCIGVTMKLYTGEGDSTCCGLDDVEDAKNVCRRLGIPHYTFNFQEAFARDVIGQFAAEYEAGRTPNPCIACNRHLKFGALWQRARELGCDYLATGHYARTRREGERCFLCTAADRTKDQTYVLYFLSQAQLAHTLFPLGDLTKAQVREVAARQGFGNARKHDSQDICFVPDGDYASYIEANSGARILPGNFVLSDGTVVGRHKGIVHYTVGQRKGLGLSLGHPVFVLDIRPETNEIIVGTNEESLTCHVRADRINFMAIEDLADKKRVWAKIRYNHRGAWCTVEKTGEDEILCIFEEPQRAVAPGQAVVLYDGEYVLGGGTIIGDE